MRDAQFSLKRKFSQHVATDVTSASSFVLSQHVEQRLPTPASSSCDNVVLQHVVSSTSAASVQHVVPSTSASSSSSVRPSSVVSCDPAPHATAVHPVAARAPGHLDTTNSMHQPSPTASSKRSSAGPHVPSKRVCSSKPRQAKRGLKRTASDPVEAISRLRAARNNPLG